MTRELNASYIHTYIHTCDPAEYAILAAVLQHGGMQVFKEGNWEEILSVWNDQPADLLIAAFDRSDLLANMTQIREAIAAPVIFITEPISEAAEVALYKAGASLVLIRPYRPRVLQIQAHNLATLRQSVALRQLPQMQIGDIYVNPSTRSVQIGDRPPQSLTPREFQLFYLLYTHQGQIITTIRVIEAIWGYTGMGDERALYSLTKRLRDKVEPTPEAPQYIITVPRTGLQLVTPKT